MFRRFLSAPRYDEHGQDTWTDPYEEVHRAEMVERDHEPAPQPPTHCSMCGKPLEAQLTCSACGDEDFRIRPDAAEGIAQVFDGDTGARRREQDAA